MTMLSDIATHIREEAAAYCESSGVPGYLAGVYHDGDQAIVAHGIANVVTEASMRDDTGFLFGSVCRKPGHPRAVRRSAPSVISWDSDGPISQVA